MYFNTELVSAPITDESVPVVVNVRLNGTPVYGALLDGGSGVNVLSNSLCAELGITKFESAPFAVKMADQRRVQPLGLVKDLDLDIAGIRFKIAAMVLKMEDISGAYPLLLGRPWLRQAKVKQNWEHNTISLRRGKKKVRLSVHATTMVKSPLRPKYAEGING